jgi:hypothetical protein
VRGIIYFALRLHESLKTGVKSSASADRKNASTDESTYLIPKEDGERVG